MEDLIYDRTEMDVAKAGKIYGDALLDESGELVLDESGEQIYTSEMYLKGALTAADLNRIEEWTAYLTEVLDSNGYLANTSLRQDIWTMTDFPLRSEMDRIRSNVDALQTGFCQLADWREILYNNTLDYNQMNTLEWDLSRIYIWLQRMVQFADFKRCGMLYCGGELY